MRATSCLLDPRKPPNKPGFNTCAVIDARPRSFFLSPQFVGAQLPKADIFITVPPAKIALVWYKRSAMSEELEVLKEVARRLDAAGIPYMLTGSTAANFYAVPRMTRDIDIVVEMSERDVERFIRAFENDHYLEPATVRQAVKSRGMFNVIHDPYVIKVDFVVRKETPYRRKEFSRRKKVSVDGQVLYLVAPEDLILSKLAWAKDSKSEVQLGDVRNLLQSVKRLDRRYLARWAKQLVVGSVYRKVAQ
jgi:hypothetical protein